MLTAVQSFTITAYSLSFVPVVRQIINSFSSLPTPYMLTRVAVALIVIILCSSWSTARAIGPYAMCQMSKEEQLPEMRKLRLTEQLR